ncbi:MAG: hypothetical protein P1V51_05130 [Deltaproteobacteria bacterium]|nr:hypothetical protein [Deltaproteobacteria bacterium]
MQRAALHLVVLLLALALVPGASQAAPAEGEAAGEAKAPSWKTSRKSALNFELGFDSNARRASSDTATLLLSPDLMAYLFGSSEWAMARPGHLLRAELEIGGKLFWLTPAENMLAGRLRLSHDHLLSRRTVLAVSGSYQDKLQRGDDPDDVLGTELACTTQGSIATETTRCNARDYRAANLEAGLDLRASEAVSSSWRLGAMALDYKPSRQFSFLAPRTSLDLRWRISLRHALAAHADLAYRLYHPDSVTWQLVPSGSGTVVLADPDTPRREWAPTLRLGWSYRSRVMVSVNGAVSRTFNNSYGLDAWRLRLDASLAWNLRPGTNLVLNVAVQSSHYPEGNVLRGLSLQGDESEQQNALTLRFSQMLGKTFSLVFKAQLYANELSGEVLPFRRLLLQAGLASRF